MALSELHYFHPTDVGSDTCAKCSAGKHADALPVGFAYPPSTEQIVVVRVFSEMLKAVTGDGGRKRAAGTKPPWWRDGSHEPAIFSHLSKWKHGEREDRDSGAHPLVHLAWRALAIAYQETAGLVDPEITHGRASDATVELWRETTDARDVGLACIYCFKPMELNTYGGYFFVNDAKRYACGPCFNQYCGLDSDATGTK